MNKEAIGRLAALFAAKFADREGVKSAGFENFTAKVRDVTNRAIDAADRKILTPSVDAIARVAKPPKSQQDALPPKPAVAAPLGIVPSIAAGAAAPFAADEAQVQTRRLLERFINNEGRLERRNSKDIFTDRMSAVLSDMRKNIGGKRKGKGNNGGGRASLAMAENIRDRLTGTANPDGMNYKRFQRLAGKYRNMSNAELQALAAAKNVRLARDYADYRMFLTEVRDAYVKQLANRNGGNIGVQMFDDNAFRTMDRGMYILTSDVARRSPQRMFSRFGSFPATVSGKARLYGGLALPAILGARYLMPAVMPGFLRAKENIQ